MAGKEQALMFGTTKIAWDGVIEAYRCVRCKGVLYYKDSFVYCPYCRRKIISMEAK